jgi:transglutaminase-like putative cysteine protease
MRIRVSQQTITTYDPPAKSIVQTLRLTPRNHDGQFVVRWRIDIDGDGRLRQGEDAFANITHHFSAAGPLERLVLTVEGEVETHDTAGVVRGTVERFPDQFYLRESPLAMADEAVRALAAEAAVGSDTLSRLHQLMEDIHGRIEPGEPSGSAATCLASRRGTPEDVAHLFIAAARHLAIPARFVSGFVHHDDAATLQGTHSWAESFVPGLGWVAFDPTLNICPAGAHVRVAMGIDALGAAPIRAGHFGGGPEQRSSRTEVAPRAGGERTEPRTPAKAKSPSRSQSQSQGQS